MRWSTTPARVHTGGVEEVVVVGRLMHAKLFALYLYIYPQSCHAPGVLNGFVYGMILRIYQLYLKEKDMDRDGSKTIGIAWIA
jgi:hypothetical protein